ncbi:hypothetical protein EX30DRAFT_135060 [Ascodesmis nigricans]|uniref:Cyclin N-terminal domain-containing protein n=1 Tax=Ascodesmis nigricans TaxID=341454 RepID=A0A4S2MN25_9PEZI|nr:hypothetical protein EX30DRAFT_135060 [Ascodesmis nigricans]
MPRMKLKSVCLDTSTSTCPSLPSVSPSSSASSSPIQSTRAPAAEECSIPSPTSSCSKAVAKKRGTRKLELRQDVLKNYNMPTYGNPSTTERFGQMTPAHEEEMQLGGNGGSTTGIAEALQQQEAVQPNDSATLITPDDTDDEFELSLEEFEKCYVPLSNLPTPPWSSESSSVEARDMGGADDNELLDPLFYGPAKYLATMSPRNASRETPSVRRLQGYLQRANLKMEAMALAGCILDCLSGRFVRQWRAECSDALEMETDSPEAGGILIVVAALCVAMKFLEDSSYTTRFWALAVCDDLFSPTVLAKTERLVLADLNYCLVGISAPAMLRYSIDEIERYAALLDAPVVSASASSTSSTSSTSSASAANSKLAVSSSSTRAPSPFPMLP